MSQETIDIISAINTETPLSGVSELEALLDTHIQKGLESQSVLFPSKQLTSVSPVMSEAYDKFCMEKQLQSQIVLSVFEISAYIGYIRSYVRNEMGITDIPVSYAIMLPLKVTRLVDGTISVVDYLYKEFSEILEYLENAD